MGSSESRLPEMEDTTNTAQQTNTDHSATRRAARQRLHSRRQREAAGNHLHGSGSGSGDDPWWWEVENENLILDRVPHVTAVYGGADSATTTDDFDSLFKIGDLTLSGGNNNAAVATSSNSRSNSVAERLEVSGEDATLPSDLTDKSEMKIVSQTATLAAAATDCVAVIDEAAPHKQTLEEFKEELRQKRLTRQTAVQDLRDEISALRRQLAAEQALTRRLRSGETIEPPELSAELAAVTEAGDELADDDDKDCASRSRHANIELANVQLQLQLANSENISLRSEVAVVQKQVTTLKEVIACCKQMLAVKEDQCNQLKSKLEEIEASFSEREVKIMSDNLRAEYERQLGNIRQLRQLYEERQRVSAAEHENLQRLISIKRDELTAEQEKTKNFEERNQTLVKDVENANNELATLREECNEHKFEKKTLTEEMGAVNTLFSQMVMGFNGKNNLDIDRLTMMLEENRVLLNDMATKEAHCGDGATLPKLLFELVEQAAVAAGSASSRSGTPTLADAVVVAQPAGRNEKTSADNEVLVADGVEGVADEAEELELLSGEDDDEEEREQQQETVIVETNNGPATATDATATAATAAVAVVVESGSAAAGAVVADVPPASGSNAAQDAVDCASQTAVAVRAGKKHYRKSVGGKTKVNSTLIATAGVGGDAATAAAVTAAAAATTTTSTLRFHEPEIIGKVASAQEIIGNLPKVWKVLMELLSHHKIVQQVQFDESGNDADCYKSVQTPNGPKAELSVSKTYIKLKDLILEKKSLVKETSRLKTLNCHLEYRLNEQEKRLSTVSLELTKTWHLVGKMQRQHRHLHTQEQILRYQLQQKRRLLTELKDELEFCRRKWAAARAKNDESQEQCNDLRREFAKRKLEDANNSAESGYSDSTVASDEDAAAGVEEELTVAVVGGGAYAASGSGGSGVGGGGCRRKRFREMFEHTRKIKRMQSTSPGRAAVEQASAQADLVLRWNSAPPTCGWRRVRLEDICNIDSLSRGAVPKAHSSRTRLRRADVLMEPAEEPGSMAAAVADVDDDSTPANDEERAERASRIQRLEEQCKSLIQQVLETSDNRERLEIQLCRFQDEIAPVQYAVPLDALINKKRSERMTRASSVPATGALTAREEEYTRKRTERLARLEEESRQLMSRIKRTSDRGHYLRCSLDRIRRGPSREGSFESNTEEDGGKMLAVDGSVDEAGKEVVDATATAMTNEETTGEATTETIGETCPETEVVPPAVLPTPTTEASPLTAEEEAYTARRAARLERLEEESRQLLSTLSRNAQRSDAFTTKLDTLHERHGNNEGAAASSATQAVASDTSSPSPPHSIEKRIENIEKISSNREERLRILEEEGKELLSRLSSTSERGTQMINRIAEREQNRQARLSATPSREEFVDASVAVVIAEAVPLEQTAAAVAASSATPVEIPLTGELLPALQNVACSSIVDEVVSERVVVTTMASQIGVQQGAVPKPAVAKSQPQAQLCAARSKAQVKAQIKVTNKVQQPDGETLEEMVRRLQSLPYPDEPKEEAKEEAKEETNVGAAKSDADTAVEEQAKKTTEGEEQEKEVEDGEE